MYSLFNLPGPEDIKVAGYDNYISIRIIQLSSNPLSRLSLDKGLFKVQILASFTHSAVSAITLSVDESVGVYDIMIKMIVTPDISGWIVESHLLQKGPKNDSPPAFS